MRVKAIALRLLGVAATIPVLDGISLFILNLYRRLRGKAQVAYVERQLVEALPAMPDTALYGALVELNAIDGVRAMSADFIERLGADATNAPVMKLIAHARQELGSNVDLRRAAGEGSLLVRLEAAWNSFQTGERATALESLRALLSDEALFRHARRNAYFRDAVVRSVEIVGADLERSGDLETALGLYHRIAIGGTGGAIERRLALLFLRMGRIAEAAMWAEQAIRPDRYLGSQSVIYKAHLEHVARTLTAASTGSEHG